MYTEMPATRRIMHTTSLGVRRDIFDLMEDHATKMNISIAEFIRRLIARFSKRYSSRLLYRGCSLAYQPPMKDYHVFVISYSDAQYEQVLDIRKVWKVSVSFFVLLAFLHYLYCESSGNSEEVRQTLAHSYMITEYGFRKIPNKRTITYIINWGKAPPNSMLE